MKTVFCVFICPPLRKFLFFNASICARENTQSLSCECRNTHLKCLNLFVIKHDILSIFGKITRAVENLFWRTEKKNLVPRLISFLYTHRIFLLGSEWYTTDKRMRFFICTPIDSRLYPSKKKRPIRWTPTNN